MMKRYLFMLGAMLCLGQQVEADTLNKISVKTDTSISKALYAVEPASTNSANINDNVLVKLSYSNGGYCLSVDGNNSIGPVRDKSNATTFRVNFWTGDIMTLKVEGAATDQWLTLNKVDDTIYLSISASRTANSNFKFN